jgi:hypothetical protein
VRAAAAFLLGLAGCASESTPACIEPVEIDPAGHSTVWVVNSVRLPTTGLEDRQFAVNLDCDPQDRPDNAFGYLLDVVLGLWTDDANGDIAEMIEAGRLLHLLDIRATSLISAEGVGVTLLHALDLDSDPVDNFSGEEPFGVDSARGTGTITGRIESSHLSARGSQLPVGFTLPSLDEVIVIPIDGASAEIDLVWDGTLSGKIAGGIPEDAINTIIVPRFAVALQSLVSRDCADIASGEPPCGCEVDSQGAVLLELFDEQPDRSGEQPDGDCVITTDEVRNNSLASSALAPDIDLFDADGELNPRSDGVKDSLSIGVGFTAVPARMGE